MVLNHDLLKIGLKALIGKELFEPKDNAISILVTSEQLFKFTYPRVNVANIQWKAEKEIEIFVKNLTGKCFSLLVEPEFTIEKIKEMIFVTQGISTDEQLLTFAGKKLEDSRTLLDYNMKLGSIIIITPQQQNGDAVIYYFDDKFCDPQFDRDFRHINDDDEIFYRGGKRYFRPCGSMRYAIKVRGKYPDEKWLGATGNDEDEWPVAYHSAHRITLPNFIKIGFDLTKCKRFVHGRAIYFNPDPEVAKQNSLTFAYKGKQYRLIFQIRVNPKAMIVVKESNENEHGEYWLLPDGDNLWHLVRPYAICVYPA